MLQTTCIPGQIVKYTNGSPAVYTGEIKKVCGNSAIVIDPTNEAERQLWDAGYAVGSYIHVSQIINA